MTNPLTYIRLARTATELAQVIQNKDSFEKVEPAAMELLKIIWVLLKAKLSDTASEDLQKIISDLGKVVGAE